MKKSFVKTYCDIGRKFYGLEVRKEGFSWKVTDVLPLSEREALLASTDPEVNVRGLETADNLLACKGCGSRKVGGCSCAYGGQRCSGDYDLMCVYCKHMKIDRSVPTSSEVRGTGGTIRLSQGQEVKIRFSDDRPLTRIKVGVGWDPARSGHSVDVDSSVVVGNSQSRDHDLVYFGDLTHPSGCVVHHGDDLTGSGGLGMNDDEMIDVDLTRVPRGKDMLIFILNIYRSDERGQCLEDVRNLYIKLYDPDSRKALFRFDVTDSAQYGSNTGIVIGAAIRRGDGWSFKAVGRGLKVASVGELARESFYYV